MSSKHWTAIVLIALFSFAAYGADSAPATTAAQRYGTWGVDLNGMDRSVKPGDDWFKFVNGNWAANTPIPPDQTTYGAFVSDVHRRRELERARAQTKCGGCTTGCTTFRCVRRAS